MVAYKPPEGVVLMIGASFRAAPLVAAAARVSALAESDREALAEFGVSPDNLEQLRKAKIETERMLRDAAIRKHDTPLQMAEIAETLARVRDWLRDLRAIATINLSHDAPTLERISSPAPEIRDGYARDALVDLELRIKAARDLKPRCEDAGLNERFLGAGTRLAGQLRTAIGKEDIDPANLGLPVRRFYLAKGSLYLETKRTARAGRYALRNTPRGPLYHTDELDLEAGPAA